MPALTRDDVFDALRQRRHYGTTGVRLFMSVRGMFDRPVLQYADDPALGPTTSRPVQEVGMGAIVAAPGATMRLEAEVVGAGPIERIDIFHGKELAQSFRPFAAGDLGGRVRVMWSGAEYRGRGREVLWRGSAELSGNRILRAEPVNFLNPEKPFVVDAEHGKINWQSVTTGNMAGFDLWLDHAKRGTLSVDTNIATANCDLATLADEELRVDGGGLGRLLRIYRLPEDKPVASMRISHEVFAGDARSGDLPVYIRVTQEDGHQAWSSPIYLIGPA
jgi:hypothetical protein